MRLVLAAILCKAAMLTGTAEAMPPMPMVGHLMGICAADTIDEARSQGSALGWRLLDDAELDHWRSRFIAHNGGDVDVLGWRQHRRGGGSLSFWIARGPNAHRACYYSSADARGLLDALATQVGSPNEFREHDFGATALWALDDMDITFSQTGTRAVVNIARRTQGGDGPAR